MERWIYDSFMAQDIKQKIETKHAKVEGVLDLDKKQINGLTKSVIGPKVDVDITKKKRAEESALGSKYFEMIMDEELDKEEAAKENTDTSNDGNYAKVLNENERLKLELGRLRRQMMNKSNQDTTDNKVNE